MNESLGYTQRDQNLLLGTGMHLECPDIVFRLWYTLRVSRPLYLSLDYTQTTIDNVARNWFNVVWQLTGFSTARL